MIDIDTIENYENHSFLNTGSPHHICFSNDVKNIDVNKEGAKIRFGSPYFNEGTNVNFVEQLNKNSFKVRTYERGVENETLACGTGVTAVALAAHNLRKTDTTTVKIDVLGGHLEVSFTEDNGSYNNIFLKGPAKFVFKGVISI